ncbi:ABC transporter, ATP-binding protein [Pseudoramibacter alactolyticus ATCC 23263]|uniref:ABC transporter, ATP-binding protein n=2 Tax=Pseudoramibacter TaxID=113286 RepID=E6MJC2_9FIRM|nr:ABC transporter ATP-binding protein [Pseudoramibacter alactolyticus]EFV00799.1 ABC transporter, ATP-binding protein [Pseudoramibacter alactolyticus ATCC 23263]
MEMSLINLTKRYENLNVVNDVSLDMTNGVYGLLGVNGAGKTTLMRMICTLIQPTHGSITYDGKDIFELKESYRKKLGYLPQDFGYYPDLSVWDYLMYIASIKGLRPSYAKKQADHLLSQVGLKKATKMKMRKLSGGMLRRVGIAQAMLNDPKILILDEPTAGLDPNERIRFRNLISEIADERLVLLSTHIVSDVEFVANKIILMNKGKFFFTGTAEDITSSIDQKAWTCTISRSDVEDYLKRYLVANVKTILQGAELRIIASQPPVEYAKEEQITLEDAFLYYFGEKAGDEE